MYLGGLREASQPNCEDKIQALPPHREAKAFSLGPGKVEPVPDSLQISNHGQSGLGSLEC